MLVVVVNEIGSNSSNNKTTHSIVSSQVNVVAAVVYVIEACSCVIVGVLIVACAEVIGVRVCTIMINLGKQDNA